MRSGASLQSERSLELFEGDGAAREVGRPAHAVALQLVFGVLAGRGEQLALSAPLRYPDRHLCRAEAREPS